MFLTTPQPMKMMSAAICALRLLTSCLMDSSALMSVYSAMMMTMVSGMTSTRK